MYYSIVNCYLTFPRKSGTAKTAHQVTFPVSYRYNGGIVIDDTWYAGYNVPEPQVPAGYKLVSIGAGLQLNARPPYATQVLVRLDGRKFKQQEVP